MTLPQFNCPLCNIKLIISPNNCGVDYFCKNCATSAYDKVGLFGANSKYKFILSEKDQLLFYRIMINEIILTGDTSYYSSIEYTGIFIQNENIMKNFYYRIFHYIELDINDPINSAKEIIEKVKLLSLFS